MLDPQSFGHEPGGKRSGLTHGAPGGHTGGHSPGSLTPLPHPPGKTGSTHKPSGPHPPEGGTGGGRGDGAGAGAGDGAGEYAGGGVYAPPEGLITGGIAEGAVCVFPVCIHGRVCRDGVSVGVNFFFVFMKFGAVAGFLGDPAAGRVAFVAG